MRTKTARHRVRSRGACALAAVLLLVVPTARADAPGRTAVSSLDATRLPQHYFFKDAHGTIYLSFQVFVDAYGIERVRYDSATKSIFFDGPQTVRIRVSDRWVDVDDRPIPLEGPVILAGDEIFIPADSFAKALGTTVNLPDPAYVRRLDDVQRKREISGAKEGFVLSSGAFFRRLIKKRTATREDACRTAAIMLQLPEALKAFPELVAGLKRAGIVPSAWTIGRDDPAPRGFSCYLMVKACGVKGGFVARTFGLNGRTAYRVAVDLQLSPATGHRSRMSGGDLMSLASKAGALRRELAGKGSAP